VRLTARQRVKFSAERVKPGAQRVKILASHIE
jgi:hypothetical protein